MTVGIVSVVVVVIVATFVNSECVARSQCYDETLLVSLVHEISSMVQSAFIVWAGLFLKSNDGLRETPP